MKGTEMIETAKPTGVEWVKCEICLKEISKSDSQSEGYRDHVVYFCSSECYEEWTKEEKTEEIGGGQ